MVNDSTAPVPPMSKKPYSVALSTAAALIFAATSAAVSPEETATVSCTGEPVMFAAVMSITRSPVADAPVATVLDTVWTAAVP